MQWYSFPKAAFCDTKQNNYPILPGILPNELRRQGATLSIANRGCINFDDIPYGLLHWSQNVSKEN